MVDSECFLKFAVRLPSDGFPPVGQSRMMSVGVKAYALEKPDIATDMASVQFMLVNTGTGGGRRGSAVRF